MRKGVIVLDEFTGSKEDNELLMIGQLSILAGCGMWMILATFFKLPVSTTHSIVGATMGFGLVARGSKVIVWDKLINIFMSWILSPLLAGIGALIIFCLLDHLVLRRERPLHSGIRVLPFVYFVCFAFNVFAVVYNGPEFLRFNELSFVQCLAISGIVGLIASLLFAFVGAPWMKKHVLQTKLMDNGSANGSMKSDVLKEKDIEANGGANGIGPHAPNTIAPTSSLASFFRSYKPEDPQASKLFSLLQVMTACFGGFAHGGNDVSNAIAPLVSLYLMYMNGPTRAADAAVPFYILLYGACGMCIGLWILGHRVIYTVAENLTKITPASGFSIEFGAAITVLASTKFGLPISSTQCKVGAVVAVGLAQAKGSVKWSTFRSICMSWIVTLPAAGIFSGTMTFLLSKIFLS
ncbi:hypothetical protein WR25_10930 isoform B [Diploscapter pachys]|nr:hypothetical protein WR25_10930 isoform B [Diploscapter pachys]